MKTKKEVHNAELLIKTGKDIDKLLTEVIEVVNQQGNFSIADQDFLYFQIGEMRDALRTALHGTPF